MQGGVMLALDPGLDATGWALRTTEGVLLRHGVWNIRELTPAGLATAIDRALGRTAVPWAATIERPYNRRGPWEAVRRLKEALRTVAKRRAKRHRRQYRVPWIRMLGVSEWRAAAGFPLKPKEAAKAAAVAWATADAGRAVTVDEAEAIALSDVAADVKGEGSWKTT